MELSSPLSRLFLVGLIPLVKAYAVFETTCSAPNPHSGFIFVSAPDTRGTLNIFWSSLFTIFACTWSLQHPDVPEQRNGRIPGLRGNIQSIMGRFIFSASMMFITAAAPEYIITKAYDELSKARQLHKKMREYVHQDRVAWTLTHSCYARMGGFAIRSKPRVEAFQLDNLENPPGQETLHCLSAEQVYELRRTEVIESLPSLGVEEIRDKSKSDTFSKAIAIGQILWTTVQIIARAAKRLPVSPLEVAVAAFAVCAVIIYGLYWYKPQRVFSPTVILDYVNGPEETLEEILKACYKEASDKRNQALLAAENSTDSTKPEITEPDITVTAARSESFANLDSRPVEWVSLIAGAIGATVFGAIHIIAWNFAFPTKIELIWWRCASVYTTAYPLGLAIIGLVVYTALKSSGSSDQVQTIVLYSFAAFFTFLYALARYFILAEVFRTLFFLPAGSFVSTWSTNIPHFA